MNNTIKTALTSTRNFVVEHKTPIIVVTAATITVVAVKRMKDGALKDAYDFIEENGLAGKFFTDSISS